MQVETFSSAQLTTLLRLVQHRWNIPILRFLYQHDGAKFVTLTKQLNISRSALSASLKYLIDEQWVIRNPGYGHPLRPEYVLNPAAEQLAATCHQVMSIIEKRNEEAVALKKWSLPIVAVIGPNPMRFSELRLALGNPTARAITLGIDLLSQHDWIEARRAESFNQYRLRPKSRQLAGRLRSGLLVNFAAPPPFGHRG